MKKCLIYIHGRGGTAAEAEHYKLLLPEREVVGVDYKALTPWEAGREIRAVTEELSGRFDDIVLVANSIGAYFAMCAGIDTLVSRAYFISPIVDMEKLIRGMMAAAGVSEDELAAHGVIRTDFGEELSWDYLCYVREHRVSWNASTEILYGSADVMTDYETVAAFAKAHSAGLTVMDGGGHWFHTPEQMAFLDGWIRGDTGASGLETKKYDYRKEDTVKINDVTIRPEREEDFGEVENLIRESFWNVYRPGCYEHYVIHVLRGDPAFVKELDFVMEKDGRIIGQNMFMRTVIDADDGRVIDVLTMGPICITPELKRKGYGKILLDYSLGKAAEMGFGAVLFEGNIGFYGKSSFDYAGKFSIRYHDLPEGADSSFFLCRELIPGYLDGIEGVYQTPQGYYVDDADVEEFDSSFPKKEKLRLPGQIF